MQNLSPALDSAGHTPDIALFIPFLGGRGANKVMLDLANSFASRGFKVDFVLAEAKGEFLDRLAPGIRLVNLRSPRGVLRALPALARYLRRVRPPVLLTAMEYVNVLALLVRHLTGVKTRVYISSHNSIKDSVKNSPWLRDRLQPLAMRLTYRWADGIVTVSNGAGNVLAEMAGLPRSRVTTIYNPVVDAAFDQRANEPLDHPWFKPGQPPVILAVGRLVYPKNFLGLTRAFARLRQHMPARLVIIGDGEKQLEIETEADKLGIRKDVGLLGFIPNPLPYMKAARVFALSSFSEGFGLVIAEALACGTPVVADDCRFGPAEILEQGRYGRLVPVGDADAFADALEKTLREAPDREMLIRRGREFSLERATDSYLRLFGLGTK